MKINLYFKYFKMNKNISQNIAQPKESQIIQA